MNNNIKWNCKGFIKGFNLFINKDTSQNNEMAKKLKEKIIGLDIKFLCSQSYPDTTAYLTNYTTDYYYDPITPTHTCTKKGLFEDGIMLIKGHGLNIFKNNKISLIIFVDVKTHYIYYVNSIVTFNRNFIKIGEENIIKYNII